MTNSEKAFEEALKTKIARKALLPETSPIPCSREEIAEIFFDLAWLAAIEFSAKVCKEKKNQIGKTAQFALGAEQCEIEIRKQGLL